MSREDANDEKRIISASRALDILSQTMPELDPSVLVAASEEMASIAASARRMREMGVLRLFGFSAVLENGSELNAMVDVG
jgi:hypothetical protein